MSDNPTWNWARWPYPAQGSPLVQGGVSGLPCDGWALHFSIKQREDFTIGNRTANSSIRIWVPLHCHSKLRWLFSWFTLLNWMSQFLIQSKSHDKKCLVKVEVPTRGPHTLSSDNILGPKQTLQKDHRCFVPSAATTSIHESSKSNLHFQWSVVEEHLLPMMICSLTNSQDSQGHNGNPQAQNTKLKEQIMSWHNFMWMYCEMTFDVLCINVTSLMIVTSFEVQNNSHLWCQVAGSEIPWIICHLYSAEFSLLKPANSSVSNSLS
jgi:hypothetical protein